MMERQFLFCLVLLAIPALTVQQACPDGYDEVDGRCFYISNEERSFEQATYDCMYRGGGSLVTIDNAEDREDAMEGSSGPVAYWINPESLDVDFYSDVQDLNCYICEAPPVCPTPPPQPAVFDYGVTGQALEDFKAVLSQSVATELGIDTVLDDLTAYREYDGTLVADLPNMNNIEVLPEHWALTYTSRPGVTIVWSLPETTNFDPNVGLPAELQLYILEAIRDEYTNFFGEHLTAVRADYGTANTDMQFDEATYGPDAVCPYPPSTDLGAGFALVRMGPTLCRITGEFETTDPNTSRSISISFGWDTITHNPGSVLEWDSCGITLIIAFKDD